MLSQEQIERAYQQARGRWQQDLVWYGCDTLRGSSTNWRATYRRSIEKLAERLRKSDIPARAMQFGDTFYLILGDEWVGLCVRLETLIAKVEDIVIYRIPEMVHQHPATGRWLSKTKLRKQLRSFLSRCRRTLEYIGDWNQRAKEFLLKGDIANATAEFNSAAEQVTKLEEEWETLQRQVALLFL